MKSIQIRMAAKDRHKIKLLEYIGNPDNEFPTRTAMSVSVLGFAAEQTLYKIFTPDELSEIEKEGLDLRRKKYAPDLAKVDKALIKEAKNGDVAAIKLAYQKLENWSEKHTQENTGLNGGPIENKWTVEFVDKTTK